MLKYEKHEKLYESDVSLPRFILRELLANIAKKLRKEQTSDLVDHFARLELNLNPDGPSLPNSPNDEFAKLLQVFTLAEQRELLKPEVKELPTLRANLKHLGRSDLITQYLDQYDPTKRIVLSVQDIEG